MTEQHNDSRSLPTVEKTGSEVASDPEIVTFLFPGFDSIIIAGVPVNYYQSLFVKMTPGQLLCYDDPDIKRDVFAQNIFRLNRHVLSPKTVVALRDKGHVSLSLQKYIPTWFSAEMLVKCEGIYDACIAWKAMTNYGLCLLVQRYKDRVLQWDPLGDVRVDERLEVEEDMSADEDVQSLINSVQGVESAHDAADDWINYLAPESAFNEVVEQHQAELAPTQESFLGSIRQWAYAVGLNQPEAQKQLFDAASLLWRIVEARSFMQYVHIALDYLGYEVVCECYQVVEDLVRWALRKMRTPQGQIVPEGKVSDFFRDVKLNLSTFFTSHLATTIKTLLTCLVTAKMFSPERARQLRDHIGIEHEKLSTMGLLEKTLDCIISISSVGEAAFAGSGITKILACGDPVAEWFGACNALIPKLPRLYYAEPIEGHFDAYDVQLELQSLLALGDQFLSALARTDNRYFGISRTVATLGEHYSLMVAEAAGKRRTVPIIVFVVGPPGIGKSKVVDAIIDNHCFAKGRKRKEQMVYNRNTKDVYWSGAKNCMPIIKYSEPAATHWCIAKSQGDESMTELLSLADSAPRNLNMADLKDKGRVWANPELIIMDGNVLDLNLPVIVNNPAAVRRRIVYVSVAVKKQFCKEGSLELDVAKSLALPENERWNVWDFSVWREHALTNHESQRRTILTHGSFAEMMKIMQQQFKAHIREQAQSLEMSRDFDLLTVVPDLGSFMDDPLAATSLVQQRAAQMAPPVREVLVHVTPEVDAAPVPELGIGGTLSFGSPEPHRLVAPPGANGDWAHISSLFGAVNGMVLMFCMGNFVCAYNIFATLPILYQACEFWRYGSTKASEMATPFLDFKEYAATSVALHFWGKASNVVDKTPGTVLRYPSITAPFARMLLDPVVVKKQNAQKQAKQKFWAHFGYVPDEAGNLALNIRDPNVARQVWCLQTCAKFLAVSATTAFVISQMKRARAAEKTASIYESLFDKLVDDEQNTQAEGNIAFKSDSNGMTKEQARGIITAVEKLTGATEPAPRPPRRDMMVWKVPPPVRLNERQKKDRDEILQSVKNNLLYVEASVGEHTANTRAIGLTGSIVLINGHSVPDIDEFEMVISLHPISEGFNRTFAKIFRSQVRRLSGDVCLIDVNNRRFRDITDLLPETRAQTNFPFIMGDLVEDFRTHHPLGDIKAHHDLRLEQPEKAMMFGVGKFFEATHVFVYDLPSHDYGVCGSALLLKLGVGYILGAIHVAGTKGGTKCFAQGLDGVEIRNAIKELREASVFPIHSEGFFRLPDKVTGFGPAHPKSVVLPRADAGLTYLGTLDGPTPVRASASKLTTTPLQPHVDKLVGVSFYEDGHPKFAPPQMWPQIKNGVRVCPTERFVEKVKKPLKTLHPAVLHETVATIMRRVVKGVRAKKGDNYKIAPLTMDVAVNGFPEDAYLRATSMSTSGGCMFPGPKRAHSDETTLPFKAEAYEPGPDVMAQVAQIQLAYLRGECAMPPLGAQLKDEARAYQKVVDGKTRMFCMTNYDALVVARMYLAPIYTLLVELGDIFYTAIGINMHSADVDKLVEKLLKFAKELMEGDYGDYDISMPFGIGQCASRIVYETARVFGYSPEALLIVQGLLSDGLFPIILLVLDLFVAPGKQTSGKYATAEDNSLRGLCMLVYAWIMMATETGRNADPRTAVKVVNFDAIRGTDFTPDDFWDNVLGDIFGDDLLAAIKAAAQQIFNNNTYAAFCEEVYGVKYTNALKTGEMSPFLSIDQASFLKRKFVYREDLGHWVAQLDLNSVMKSIAFTLPSKAVSMEHQVYAATQSALRELFFYLKEDDYEERRKLFARTVEECLGIKYETALVGYPTFQQTRLQVYGEDEGHVKQLATGDDD